MRFYSLFIFLFLVTACGQELRSPTSRASRTTEFNSVTCSCSDYQDPVCGTNGAQYITFINGCIAQCNGYDYTSGACDPSVGAVCDQSSGQVCGLPPCPNGGSCPSAKIYSDSCALSAAGATKVDISQCSLSI